jgi:hypothetical protein
VPREDVVHAKGKGAMKTFWLEISPRCGRRSTNHSTTDASSSGITEGGDDLADDLHMDSRMIGLVNWNTDVLAKLLVQIAAKRTVASPSSGSEPLETREFHLPNQTLLDEVKEIIHLPDFDGVQAGEESIVVDLSEDVMNQLRSLVTCSKFMVAPEPHCWREPSFSTFLLQNLSSTSCFHVSEKFFSQLSTCITCNDVSDETIVTNCSSRLPRVNN